MRETDDIDTRSKEETLASIRYRQNQTPAERSAEGWQLSIVAYGMPQGNFRDGPYRIIRCTPDGEEEIIREWSGPNPLHYTSEQTLGD